VRAACTRSTLTVRGSISIEYSPCIVGEIEAGVQVRHQVAHLLVAQIGRRAAAEVQLFDLAHAGEQAALHVDFLLQVAEVGRPCCGLW
jgi:hypothetical protein